MNEQKEIHIYLTSIIQYLHTHFHLLFLGIETRSQLKLKTVLKIFPHLAQGQPSLIIVPWFSYYPTNPRD